MTEITSSTHAPGWVRHGQGALDSLGPELDRLIEDTRAPVTMGRAWLETWFECFPSYEPLVVGVDGGAGELDAMAVLGLRSSRGLSRIVAGGHGPTDAVMLPARDDVSAVRLAETLRLELLAQGRPWTLTLRHVVAKDRVVPHLGTALPHVRILPGDVSPLLIADSGPVLRSYVSRNHHNGISRIRNRMKRAGLDPRTDHIRDAGAVLALLSEVEHVYRRRDEALGRRCLLDVPSHRDFFRMAVSRHAEAGQLVLSTLRLGSELAAYTLCFLDGDTFRMWNHRFHPDWGRYSPGKLSVDDSVAYALAQGCDAYDFMRGDETYKESYANRRPVAMDLHASSGPIVAAGTALFLGSRERIRQMEATGGQSAHLAARVRSVRHLGRDR